MDIERLIECVRKHVFLYDLTHVDYKNVNLKTAVWEAIGNELNQSADAVRTKWKTLRDAYTKYRKIAKSSGGSNKRLSQYLWSTQLSFLDGYNTPRYGNVTESPPYNQTQDLENLQEFTLPLANLPAGRPNDRPKGTKRKDTGNLDHNIFNCLYKKKKSDYDGVDHLFLSYAETFRRFPPREQAILKLELAKLFSNTELKLLENENSRSQYTSVTQYSNDWIDTNDIKTETNEKLKVETDLSEEVGITMST